MHPHPPLCLYSHWTLKQASCDCSLSTQKVIDRFFYIFILIPEMNRWQLLMKVNQFGKRSNIRKDWMEASKLPLNNYFIQSTHMNIFIFNWHNFWSSKYLIAKRETKTWSLFKGSYFTQRCRNSFIVFSL